MGLEELRGRIAPEGRLPLWNPRIFLGTPFLAKLTSAVFYPPNLLPALLPLPFAWALAFVLRTSLSFLFSALLARELGASRSGQLLAGLVFSLGGFAVVWQGWPQSDVAAWLPACVLAFERLAKRPGPLRAAFAALALAMAFLAGHPETFLYVSGTTAAWVAFRLALPPERENGPATRRAAAAWSAAALLAVPALVAVQLLPFLEWMGQLSRGFDTVWAWRAPWSALVALVSRDGRSNPELDPDRGAGVGLLRRGVDARPRPVRDPVPAPRRAALLPGRGRARRLRSLRPRATLRARGPGAVSAQPAAGAPPPLSLASASRSSRAWGSPSCNGRRGGPARALGGHGSSRSASSWQG